ncbi:MAG: MFS transporter [Legionellales bacterium]|nr:MFS transporter [Legionellales bacterium]
MGFFTDAYDLFVIGIVTAILRPLWGLSIEELAILNGAALAAAACGSVFFGILADKFGRKKMYGVEIAILFIGAILSAIAPSFGYLLFSRILVGLGIGGDYPTSALIASENAGKAHRGFLVLLVFAMQALGLTIGPLIASFFLYINIPTDMVWRILLGIGAIPAASVFYLRRRIQESPRFLMTKNAPVEVSRVIADITGMNPNNIKRLPLHSLMKKKWLICLFGTAGAWFLLDIAFYGNSVSSFLILKTLNPAANMLKNTLLSSLIFLICAVPGYLAAAFFVDKIGRRFLQFLGFAMMGLMYLILAGIPSITQHVNWFLIVFGVSYFFTNFGPNTTTFLIPSEVYPTSIRGKAHGFSAAVGKVGAFIGAFFLPFVLEKFGLQFTMGLMAIVCVLGVSITFLVPEMKGQSLEVTEEMAEEG